VVPTPASRHFIPVDEIRAVEGADVYLDEEEWTAWKQLKDPVLHIEVRGLNPLALALARAASAPRL
jgi:hypothetical protein